MDANHTIHVLNGLVAACHDGHEGYQAAAHAVKDANIRKLFRKLALDRKELIDQLGEEVARHGGKPAERGTAKAAAHRGWIDLASRTWPSDHLLLKEVDRGERATLALYREAAVESLPMPTRGLIERQLKHLDEVYARIRELVQVST